MATPDIALAGRHFNLNGDAAAMNAIATNGDVPGDVPLDKLSAQIDGQGSWTVPAPSGDVQFAISGKASAGIGVYTNPKMLLNDLGFGADGSGAGLSFDIANVADARYVVFRCGYTASGSLNGTMALSPYGSVTFGAEGRLARMYALIRRDTMEMKAGDAFNNLCQSVISPSAVNSLLPQGTWIVSECDGQLSASLGVRAGYVLNWVRNLNLQGVSGDVGMKIAAGASLSLGASLAGKFYLVLSCDDNPNVVRYRLFRSSTKGWNFALNAGVDITPSTGNFDPSELLKGIFGIHAAQFMQYLQSANATDLANDGLNELLKSLDKSSDVQKGFAVLQNFFAKWQTMPQDVTSLLWKHASDSSVIAQLTSAAKAMATSNPQTISGILNGMLRGTSLASDPVAQWLEAAASQDIFSLYESSAAGAEIRSAAKQLLGILDGSDMQNALQNLQSNANTMLDLPTLESAIQSGNVAGVAVWVQKQLAQFLGVNTSGLSGELAKLDQIIDRVRSKGDQLYEAAIKALNQTYSFSLNYAYQASDTRTALVDLEFDANAISSGLLRQAVAGNFADLLTQDTPGVRLNAATLTHSISREGKLAIHLPHYVSTADHILTGASQDKIVDSQSGRINLFDATAKDEELERGNNNVQRYAALSLGISGVATAVRKFDVQSVDFGYEIRNLRRAMCRSEFQTQYGPVVQQYFPKAFANGSSDPNHAGFVSWVIDWDKFTDAHPDQTPTGDGVIGNVWSDTQLKMSSGENVTWVDVLLGSKTQLNFAAMGTAMQSAYRSAVLRSYMSDPENLTNTSGPAIDAFLCWVSLPLGELDTRPEVLAGPITSDTAIGNLSATRAAISSMLQGIPALQKFAQFWDPRLNVVRNWLQTLAQDMNRVQEVVSLLDHEQEMIDTAKHGFQSLQHAGAAKLDHALDTLVQAGLDLTSAFNSKMGSVFDRAHVVRYFGPLMFQAAVEAMFPGKAPKQTDVRLDLAVLKGTDLPATDDPPANGAILLQQVLVNFS